MLTPYLNYLPTQAIYSIHQTSDHQYASTTRYSGVSLAQKLAHGLVGHVFNCHIRYALITINDRLQIVVETFGTRY